MSGPKCFGLDFKDPELLAMLDRQHEELRFAKFSQDIAFELGLALRKGFEEKFSNGKNGIIICIRTFLGQSLFSCSIGAPGTTGPGNWQWAQRKENVVRTTGKASFHFGRVLDVTGKKPEDVGMPFPEFAAHGGGVPIWVKSNTVGPVAIILVSGLPQQDDHTLIVETLQKFLPTLEQ